MICREYRGVVAHRRTFPPIHSRRPEPGISRSRSPTTFGSCRSRARRARCRQSPCKRRPTMPPRGRRLRPSPPLRTRILPIFAARRSRPAESPVLSERPVVRERARLRRGALRSPSRASRRTPALACLPLARRSCPSRRVDDDVTVRVVAVVHRQLVVELVSELPPAGINARDHGIRIVSEESAPR